MQRIRGPMIYSALILVPFLGIVAFQSLEPVDPPRCEEVHIVGRKVHFKSDQFIVESDAAPHQRWYIGRFKTPFSEDYLGPAGLLLAKGRWTDVDRLSLIQLCPSAVERHIQEGWQQ